MHYVQAISLILALCGVAKEGGFRAWCFHLIPELNAESKFVSSSLKIGEVFLSLVELVLVTLMLTLF